MGEGTLTRGGRSPRTFCLLVEYDGSRFMGWQVQPDVRTVQGDVEKVLARVLGERVRVSGAGRTDRGVHALGQVASFQAVTDRSPGEILGGLTSWLPPDILVKEVTEVSPDFHARHSARRRRYRYLMRLERTALERDRCWVLPHSVRVGRMRKAAEGLLGEHDFRQFRVGASDDGNTRVRVHEVSLRRRGPVLGFEIEANRFLRKMVRAIVGALVEVGRGQFDTKFIGGALGSGETVPPFSIAPAQGLYLMSVIY